MGKYNWKVGLYISLGVSVLASLPRLLRQELPDTGTVFNTLLNNFIFSIFCWAVHSHLAARQIKMKFASRFLTAALSIILTGFISYLLLMFFVVVLKTYTVREVPGNRRLFFSVFRGMILSGFYYFIIYYLNLLKRQQKSLLEIEQLKQSQLQARIFSLKEQLSPHFMFNSLNTLSSLTSEPAVKEYVNKLGNVYRYVLHYKEHDAVTLQQELEFIDSYLYILKTRFEDAICVQSDINKEILKSKVPPLVLQILIENAVKHNIVAASKPLMIRLYTENMNLVIENTYQPKLSAEPSTGKGLDNIVERYRLLFGKEIIIENTSSLFTVKLPVII